jgi:hypothetical protein
LRARGKQLIATMAIIGNHWQSLAIIGNHRQSPTITENHKKSPRGTRDVREKLHFDGSDTTRSWIISTVIFYQFDAEPSHSCDK